jgi:hypothetical protein
MNDLPGELWEGRQEGRKKERKKEFSTCAWTAICRVRELLQKKHSTLQ